jgi:hypothetical protein
VPRSGDDDAATAAPTKGPTATLDAAAHFRQIVVSPDDLLKDFTVELYAKGDQVKGQVTLDYCGYGFSTERHWVARRQVRILRAGKDTGAPTRSSRTTARRRRRRPSRSSGRRSGPVGRRPGRSLWPPANRRCAGTRPA